MKKPLVVGDRVRVYWTAGMGFLRVATCTIKSIDTDGVLRLLTDEGKLDHAHPKQCRRLVRKPHNTYYGLKNRETGLISMFLTLVTREAAEQMCGIKDTVVELVERRRKKGTK